MKLVLFSIAVTSIFFLITANGQEKKYEPNWQSLDSRPLPNWYDEAKIGIFIHWGVFSVHGFGSEWFWWNWQGLNDTKFIDFMNRNYPGRTYAEFAPNFRAEFFNSDQWAELFNKSGAKYVVLTSKHHEGYTLWPSESSWNWNAMDVGPKQDLVGKLAGSVRSVGLKFGVYHSLYEWFNPLYLEDKGSNWFSRNFVREKTMPELYDLVNKYHPEVIWSDGDWEVNETYWGSTDFLAWLYNESPVKDTVVTNDRWGQGVTCKHGDFLTCSDRFNPGKLMTKKWENAMTLDKNSWGYVRPSRLEDYLSIRELLLTLVQTISYGGNILINVGPTPDGRIPPIMEERLLQLGSWLDMNGNAVYGTRPWLMAQNDTLTKDVYYTRNGSTFYVFFFDWPSDGVLRLGSMKPFKRTVFYLNDGSKQGTRLNHSIAADRSALVSLPCYLRPTTPGLQWAWTLTAEGL